MSIQESIDIAAPAAVVFDIWSDVANWNRWDPDTRESFLSGPFEVGSRGRIVPARGRGVPFVVTECTWNTSFTVEAFIPGFRMRFEHVLEPAPASVRATHRVTFFGPLRFLFGPLVDRQVRHGLPATMRSLKAYAESRS
jgi:hypothetical protein